MVPSSNSWPSGSWKVTALAVIAEIVNTGEPDGTLSPTFTVYEVPLTLTFAEVGVEPVPAGAGVGLRQRDERVLDLELVERRLRLGRIDGLGDGGVLGRGRGRVLGQHAVGLDAGAVGAHAGRVVAAPDTDGERRDGRRAATRRRR